MEEHWEVPHSALFQFQSLQCVTWQVLLYIEYFTVWTLKNVKHYTCVNERLQNLIWVLITNLALKMKGMTYFEDSVVPQVSILFTQMNNVATIPHCS